MARGSTLLRVIDLVRTYSYRSLNQNLGAQERAPIVNRIQAEYERLWDDWDWSFKRVERSILLQAGQRFYDPPSDVDPEDIEQIAVRYGNKLVPLRKGIDDRHYLTFDSRADERNWPVHAWRMLESDTGLSIEIWPVPSQNGAVNDEGELIATGIRSPSPLVEDGDQMLLDDQVVARYVAADLLVKDNPNAATLQRRTADTRLSRLKGRGSQKTTMVLSEEADYTVRPRGPLPIPS